MASPAVLVAQALWLMLPAYLANMSAALVGGGPPIDGGRVHRDGRRLLGDGKTWRGLFLGPAVGVVLTAGFRVLATVAPLSALQLADFGPWPWWILLAYALGLGALLGDTTESYFKRRRGLERGARWLGPDQLDFVVGAWVVGFLVATVLHVAGVTSTNWFLANFTLPVLVIVAVLTPALHLLVNYIGWKLGTKDVPW